MSNPVERAISTERRATLEAKLRNQRVGETTIASLVGTGRSDDSEREVARRVVAWARQLRKES